VEILPNSFASGSASRLLRIHLKDLFPSTENSRFIDVSHVLNPKASLCVFDVTVYASVAEVDALEIPDTENGLLNLIDAKLYKDAEVGYRCGPGQAFEVDGELVEQIDITCTVDDATPFTLIPCPSNTTLNPNDCGYGTGAWSPDPKNLPPCICKLVLNLIP